MIGLIFIYSITGVLFAVFVLGAMVVYWCSQYKSDTRPLPPAPLPPVDLMNLDDPPPARWEVESKNSDGESDYESSEVDYDSLCSSHEESRSSSPVLRSRASKSAAPVHVHVHTPPAPARDYIHQPTPRSAADTFADFAMTSAMANILASPARPIIVQAPAAAPPPAAVSQPPAAPQPAAESPAPVAHGKSSTARDAPYAAAVAYGASSTADRGAEESWWGAMAPAVSRSASAAPSETLSSGWSASSGKGKSTTR